MLLLAALPLCVKRAIAIETRELLAVTEPSRQTGAAGRTAESEKLVIVERRSTRMASVAAGGSADSSALLGISEASVIKSSSVTMLASGWSAGVSSIAGADRRGGARVVGLGLAADVGVGIAAAASTSVAASEAALDAARESGPGLGEGERQLRARLRGGQRGSL